MASPTPLRTIALIGIWRRHDVKLKLAWCPPPPSQKWKNPCQRFHNSLHDSNMKRVENMMRLNKIFNFHTNWFNQFTLTVYNYNRNKVLLLGRRLLLGKIWYVSYYHKNKSFTLILIHS